MFRENRHHAEGLSGALYLSSFGQIVLNPNTNITFLNNNGRSASYEILVSSIPYS